MPTLWVQGWPRSLKVLKSYSFADPAALFFFMQPHCAECDLTNLQLIDRRSSSDYHTQAGRLRIAKVEYLPFGSLLSSTGHAAGLDAQAYPLINRQDMHAKSLELRQLWVKAMKELQKLYQGQALRKTACKSHSRLVDTRDAPRIHAREAWFMHNGHALCIFYRSGTQELWNPCCRQSL